MKINEQYFFNIVLVHVSRTWERIRLEQEWAEMPYDNIESVDKIIEIADEIMSDSIIEKFLTSDLNNWDWGIETEEGCSDSYIEKLATELIYSDILEITNNISEENYIIWDIIKDEPVDDMLYHHSTLIKMINNFELSLQEGEEIKCVSELPLKWKLKYNKIIHYSN